MFKIRVMNQEVIEKVLDMKKVVETVEEVYRIKENEKSVVFPLIFHEFERGVADMDIKSGHLIDEEIYGMKLVSWYGENPKQGLPALIGTTMIYDSKTGVPMGLLNADHITGMRTGAAGAIGAKYLANPESENLLMVGAGHVSTFAIAGTLVAMENIKTVRIYDPMDVEGAKALVAKLPKVLEEKFLDKYVDSALYEVIKKKFDVTFEVVENLQSATEISDVILTATPSRAPMVMNDWVKEGTHISCIGSDMSGKREIDGHIMTRAKVFVDDVNQSISVGETEMPIKEGIITEASIIGEIGSVILGKNRGRTSKEDITVFDTSGIALQDLLTSKVVLEKAKEMNLGVMIDL